MEANDERTSLLNSSSQGGTRQEWPFYGGGVREDDRESYVGVTDSEDDSGSDATSLNEMMAQYSTSVASLGLDGGVQGFPSGLRRGSVASNFRPSRPVRRDSRFSRRKSRSIVPETRDVQTSQIMESSNSSKPSVITIEDVAESVSESDHCRQEEFLGNVSRGRFWAIFSSILLVYFVACFDSTLMASSHPVITSYFHASNLASWLSTAFLLTSTAFQPIFGRVSDTFGRRNPFLFSIAVFALGTLWCAVAPSIISFILARAVCGLGAGGAIAMGAIINSDLVPLHIRGKYQALLNVAFGIGSSSGAAMGGFLADALGWRWEFGLQVPAILFAFLVAWMTVPDNLGPQLAKGQGSSTLQALRGFDTTGAVSQATSVTLLVFALNLGGNILPWSHPFIILAIAGFFVGSAILIFAERRAEKPIMPLELLSSSPRGNLVISHFLTSMTMNTVLFNLPLYFQAVLLDNATQSGLRLVLPFLFSMAAGFSTGHLISYSRKLRPTLLGGSVLVLIGSILLVLMRSSFPTWAYTFVIAVASMGQGFSYPSVSLSMLATSTTEDIAVATSTLYLWRSLGSVMGVAASSVIVQNALVYYLDALGGSPEEQEFIHQVRRSIEAIGNVPERYRAKIIQAYASSLRFGFAFAIATSAIALLLILRIDLPILSNRHDDVKEQEQHE